MNILIRGLEQVIYNTFRKNFSFLFLLVLFNTICPMLGLITQNFENTDTSEGSKSFYYYSHGFQLLK